MLRFHTIKKDCEIDEFCSGYRSAIAGQTVRGFDITPDVLKKKDQLVGIFLGSKLVGGYALSNRPDFLLKNITKENLQKMEEFAPVNSCCELANIWRGRSLPKALFAAIVWPRLIIDAVRFNPKKSNIVGYVFSGHGRAHSYDLAKPRFVQVSNKPQGLNIFVMKKGNLVLAYFKGVVDEVSRKFLRHKTM